MNRKTWLFALGIPALLALLLALPAQAAFTDNSDGTITDGVTGLMWDKCSWGQSNDTTCAATAATTHTWAQALGVAVTANAMNSGAGYKGHTDWRLPNKNELESLVKIDASSPAIDTTAFPNTPSSWYWSSTNYAPVPACAWSVYFVDGYTYCDGESNGSYVRLVRSGQSFGSFDSQADTTAPGYQSAALNAGLTVATLTFDEAPVNNLASIDPLLKANITFASDGTTFTALAAGDVVALAGSTVTVTFASALTGSTNKLKIAANSLKDAAGNVLASAVTTAALDASDTTPDAFSFTAATNAALSTATESAAITVTGINAAAAISISGGQYAVSTDSGGSWGAFTAGAGTVNLNDQAKVKLTSSANNSTAVSATLTIGGVSAVFSATTLAAPAPAPVYSAPPPAPSVINAPKGAETSLNGTTPVNAALGSTLVIPAGVSVSGVAITLAAPATGLIAEAVTLKIGGNTLTVTPTGANVVVTLKTITLNGVATLVLAVSSGAVTVSATPGQPLLTLGNSGVVITAGAEGGTVAFDASGAASLSVTGGYVVLPANAFAEIKDGKLYAGEIAQLDADGKVAKVRLGSLGGSAVGDPLKTPVAAGLTLNATLPNLKGKVARLSATQDFTEILAAALGASSKGQNGNGVLGLTTPIGSTNALPVGDIGVDTSRADGITVSGNGRKEVVKGGVIVNLVPTVTDPAQLAAQVVALDKNAAITLNDYGAIRASLNGATYAVQPGWAVDADGGAAGFGVDALGYAVYRDSGGNRQTLYPAFIDLNQIIAAFKPTDADVAATGNADGTVTASYLGASYTLMPDYLVLPLPAAHATDAWWLDGAKVFVRNSDGKTAQGFSVK